MQETKKKNTQRNSTKNITRRWFDAWANEYDQSLGTLDFHRGLLALTAKQSGVKDGDQVLDIGCGTGLLSLRLLAAADCFVTGIDNSKEMLALCEDKIKKLKLTERARLQLMDAEKLSFKNNSFNLVVSSVALHHVKDKLPALKKIRSVIKPGGKFILADIDMDSTGELTDIKRLRRIVRILEREWIVALKAGKLRVFEKMYDNGKQHIFNRGDFCVSFSQWARLCKKAGFSRVSIRRVAQHRDFGIVIAQK